MLCAKMKFTLPTQRRSALSKIENVTSITTLKICHVPGHDAREVKTLIQKNRIARLVSNSDLRD